MVSRFIHVHTRKEKLVTFLNSCDCSPTYSILLQPAPETEGDMMIEVFKYTERVVNMIRPRKLLFMAIGGSTLPTTLSSLTFS
jgi:hypothetical protein